MNTKPTKTLILALGASALLLATGLASAQSSASQQTTATARDTQTITVPSDNVLLALALGGSPRLSDVADVHRTTTTTSSQSTSRDISTDDALLALALQHGGSSSAERSLLLGDRLGFSTFGSFGTFPTFRFSNDVVPGSSSSSATASRVVDQTVSFDRDTVLSALALGQGGFFGFDGLRSVADFDRNVTDSTSFTTNTALDSNSVLATLALRG